MFQGLLLLKFSLFSESSVYNLDIWIQKINGSDAIYSNSLNDSSTSDFKTLAGNLEHVVSTSGNSFE